MSRFFKQLMIYVPVLVVLLHNVVPHWHKSDLSEQEHILLHKQSQQDVFEVISLLFHELTETGDMETYFSDSQGQESKKHIIAPLIGVSPILFFPFFVSEIRPAPAFIFPSFILPVNYLYYPIGVRPPPFFMS